MAFKQKCPSCENPVLIKDASLIGKKIVCPKCKDTFAIAAPVEVAVGAAAGSGAKAKAGSTTAKTPLVKRKKTDDDDYDDSAPEKQVDSGGSKKLIIGASVAAAVVAIGVLVFALSGEDAPAPVSSGPPSTAKNVASSGTGEAAANPEVAGGGKPVASSAPETNLLPNNSQGVLSVDVSKFRNTPLSSALMGNDGDAEFEKKMGFRFSEIKNAWIASNYTQGWVFAVLKTSKTLNPEILRAAMDLDGSRRMGSGNHELMPIRSNEMIDLIGSGITGALEDSGLPALKYPETRQFALHIYDPHTLIVADIAPLEEFLKGDRLPKAMTQVSADTSPATGTPGGAMPGPGGAMPGPGMMPGPGGAMPTPGPKGPAGPSPVVGGPAAVGSTPGAGGPTPVVGGPAAVGSTPGTTPKPGSPAMPAPGGTPPAIFSTDTRFLTIDPGLKSMISYLETDANPIMTLATRLPGFSEKMSALLLLAKISKVWIPANLDKFPQSPVVGLSLTALRQDKGAARLAIQSESDTGFVALNEFFKNGIVPLAEVVVGYFGMPVAIIVDGASNTNNPNGTGGPGAMPGPGGMPGPGMMPPAGPGARPGPGGGASGPGAGNTPQSGTISPGSSRPGTSNFQNQLPPVQDDPSDRGPRPGPGGMPGPGSPRPGMPGPGGMPGPAGPRPGGPASTPAANLPPSWLRLTTSDRIVSFSFELDWKLNYPERVSYPVRSFVEAQKGRAIIASRRNTWYNLAGAVKKLEAAPTYPRGAMDRKLDNTRMGRPWNPDQRVSWMVELLPHLGRGNQYARVQKDQSWNTEDNVAVGESLIPEFINPNTPASTWRVKASGLKDHELAVTHYVGLSGIGMDSAEDVAGQDPKKLGIFGYDRTVKVEDVRNGDGLSNTILMIQVPASPARAWIRGGGATVQGVQPTNSLRPFLSPQTGGKAGTHALMADGSVRFLPANLPDALFQGMVTYAGGEKLDKLDELAPLQEIPGRKTELKGGAAPELLNPKK